MKKHNFCRKSNDYRSRRPQRNILTDQNTYDKKTAKPNKLPEYPWRGRPMAINDTGLQESPRKLQSKAGAKNKSDREGRKKRAKTSQSPVANSKSTIYCGFDDYLTSEPLPCYEKVSASVNTINWSWILDSFQPARF